MIPTYIMETVYDFLRETHNGSLENTFKNFSRKCSEAYNLFTPCFLLVQALSDNEKLGQVLTKQQRLVAIYLISEAFKAEDINPFTLALIDVYEKALDQFERKMIADLLVRNQREAYGYKTLRTLTEEQDKFFEECKYDSDIEDLKRQMVDNLTRIPTTALTQMRHIVPDSMNIDKKNEPPQQIPFIEKVNSLDRDYIGYEPDFLRPCPSPLPIQPEEDLRWIDSGIFCDLQWDYNICVTSNALSIVKELLQKAQQTTLNPDEYKLLEDHFKQESIIKSCGFLPSHLPEMVEKNPNVVSLLLRKLSQQPNIEEYFEKLSQIEITLAVLEVVNKLVNSMQIPKEFLQYFISTCIHQCQNQREKSNLTRMVRLVCVFIKAMIKQKNFNPKDMYIELQAFCIDHSKISEAGQLFKQLKALESPQPQQQQQGPP